MEKIRPKLGIESTDKYAKARQDVIQALNSVGELESWQKEQLAKELLGADLAVAVYHAMRQYWG